MLSAGTPSTCSTSTPAHVAALPEVEHRVRADKQAVCAPRGLQRAMAMAKAQGPRMEVVHLAGRP